MKSILSRLINSARRRLVSRVTSSRNIWEQGKSRGWLSLRVQRLVSVYRGETGADDHEVLSGYLSAPVGVPHVVVNGIVCQASMGIYKEFSGR